MIYCNLKGGLGNMMFQIAALKSLAKDNESDVVFSNLINHFDFLNKEVSHNPKVNYAQEYINIFKNISFNNEVSTGASVNIEFPFDFVKLKFKDKTRYSGFFQSENYFIHNRNYILNLFEPNDVIKKYIIDKYSNVLNHKTCSIHVRRGDYLKSQETHPVQSLQYFESAIFTIKEIDKYLVFSDDIKWCKENFIGDKFLFIEEDRDYIELFLMSQCNHNIIANSSFSWWGAWLNKNENKIVVAPSKWFGENSEYIKQEGINDKDILPKSWIKI